MRWLVCCSTPLSCLHPTALLPAPALCFPPSHSKLTPRQLHHPGRHHRAHPRVLRRRREASQPHRESREAAAGALAEGWRCAGGWRTVGGARWGCCHRRRHCAATTPPCCFAHAWPNSTAPSLPPPASLPSLPPCPSKQGDWGTQFGMLIQFMAEKRPGGLNAATDEDVADLQVRAAWAAGWCSHGLCLSLLLRAAALLGLEAGGGTGRTCRRAEAGLRCGCTDLSWLAGCLSCLVLWPACLRARLARGSAGGPTHRPAS